MDINFKTTPLFDKLNLPVPSQQSHGAAGIDMMACIENPVVLEALDGRLNIPTGVMLEIPEGYFALACPRSGLAYKHGVTLVNGPGVIDSDYRGEIMGIMINHGPSKITIQPGDRIFQLIILPYPRVQLIRAEELDNTVRGRGGFGSTGM